MARPAQLVLLISCLPLIFGVVFKLSHKRIAPLFLLQSLGNYCALCVIHVLIGYIENEKSKKRREEILGHFKILHVAWYIITIIGYKYSYCNQKDIYPWPFFLNLGLFVAVFLYVHVMKKKGFALQWADHEEKGKQLFLAQIDRFYQSMRFLVFWHIAEVVVGKTVDTFSSEIGCA